MRLSELAAMVRSKNAGPFVLTFDILFSDCESYERVKRSGALNVEIFARLYKTAPSQVRFFECDKALGAWDCRREFFLLFEECGEPVQHLGDPPPVFFAQRC